VNTLFSQSPGASVADTFVQASGGMSATAELLVLMVCIDVEKRRSDELSESSKSYRRNVWTAVSAHLHTLQRRLLAYVLAARLRHDEETVHIGYTRLQTLSWVGQIMGLVWWDEVHIDVYV